MLFDLQKQKAGNIDKMFDIVIKQEGISAQKIMLMRVLRS